MKPKPRKHRFVVGYVADGNCVWGNDAGESVLPMTELQAKRAACKLPCRPVCIFKLVEVERVKGKR